MAVSSGDTVDADRESAVDLLMKEGAVQGG